MESCKSVQAAGDARLAELLAQNVSLSSTRERLLRSLEPTLRASGRIEGWITLDLASDTTIVLGREF